MAIKYEISNSTVDENALMENFDYEPNSNDTGFSIPSIKESECENNSSVKTEAQKSIITVESDSEDEFLAEYPQVKQWIDVLQLEATEALAYKKFLWDNIVDIPRVFWKIINDQLFYIEKFF